MSNQTNYNLLDDVVENPAKRKVNRYYEQGLLTEKERDRINADLDRQGDFDNWTEEVAECCSPKI